MKAVARGDTTIHMLARSLKRSNTRTSVIVKALEEKGFLTRARHGQSYEISFPPNRFMDHLKPFLISEGPQLECIADNGMFLLGLLTGPASDLRKRDLIMISNLSNSTVRDFLNKGVNSAVLKREGTRYRISNSLGGLRDFILDYSAFATWNMLSRISQDCVVHWRYGFEMGYSTSSESRNPIGQITAVTAFSASGVDFLANRAYYHYTSFKREIGLEDHILDAIMVDKADPRNVLNSTIFLKKMRGRVDEQRLMSMAVIFGLQERVKEMLDFLNGKRDKIPDVIDRKEFDGKYRVYE
jgi:hypothetical protein